MWKEVNILSTNFSAKHTPSATLNPVDPCYFQIYFSHAYVNACCVTSMKKNKYDSVHLSPVEKICMLCSRASDFFFKLYLIHFRKKLYYAKNNIWKSLFQKRLAQFCSHIGGLLMYLHHLHFSQITLKKSVDMYTLHIVSNGLHCIRPLVDSEPAEFAE